MIRFIGLFAFSETVDDSVDCDSIGTVDDEDVVTDVVAAVTNAVDDVIGAAVVDEVGASVDEVPGFVLPV